MPKSGEMSASKPHSLNKIGGPRKAAPKAAEKLGQRVEKFAHPYSIFSRLKSVVQ